MKIKIEILSDSVNKKVTLETEAGKQEAMLNHDITEMLQAAHEAGKNGETVEVETDIN